MELYISPELKKIENIDNKLQHLSSNISEKLLRADSKFLSAYARCGFDKACPVTYTFQVKEKIYINEYITVNVDIINSHNHSTSNKPVKGSERKALGNIFDFTQSDNNSNKKQIKRVRPDEDTAVEAVDVWAKKPRKQPVQIKLKKVGFYQEKRN